MVVTEYKAHLVGRKMSLDREYEEPLFEAKKKLEAEFTSKVDAAVREQAAKLDSAQRILEEDRRRLEDDRQRLKEDQRRQQLLMTSLEQVASALKRVPFGSSSAVMDLVNKILIQPLQNQLMTAQNWQSRPAKPLRQSFQTVPTIVVRSEKRALSPVKPT
jgi:hypothetical protein